MPSFDIVSELDNHEVTNAVDQANREIQTRFDFKDVDASFTLSDNTITMQAESDFQLQQMLDILQKKVTKRGIDLQSLEVKDPVLQLSKATQEIKLKQGIDQDSARKIIKIIKESKMKVQAQIQGDQIRVNGKKRDDLQEAIAMLRQQNLGLPVQFGNFRD